MRSPNSLKLAIAVVVLLVCGVIVTLVVQSGAPKLALKLNGLETNRQGLVTANILASHPGPQDLRLSLRIFSPPGVATNQLDYHLASPGAQIHKIQLPGQWPCRVYADSSWNYSPNKLSHRVRIFLVTRFGADAWPIYTTTLDIP